jgi:hypothetical protein
MCMIAVVEPGEWMEAFAVAGVERAEAAELKNAVTLWLVEQGAIEAAEWRNALGPIGHGRGPHAASLFDENVGETQLGLVEIYASGEGILVCGKPGPIFAHCPHCRARQGFTAAVLDAWEKDAEADAACNSCRRTSGLEQWDGGKDFAFARLSVTFNHWPPIRKSFKQDLSLLLHRREIRTIRARA